MELNFNSFEDSYNSYQAVYETLLHKTLEHLALRFDPVVSVTLVDNNYIQVINRDYRHLDQPTDVIAFAFLDDCEDRERILHSGSVVILGEIYISFDQAKVQAENYGHSLERELKFLFVHGLLHLLGYDHMTEEDERSMFALQDKILPKDNL
ncbi:MAG: rRNA maturation RNase YbeY [Erysipelotrichia bacterium]|nr:rRNA maturation RNase YbeY [Erysipelotrichia bacterium]